MKVVVCVCKAADTLHARCNIQYRSVNDTFSHCSPVTYWVQNIYILGESEKGEWCGRPKAWRDISEDRTTNTVKGKIHTQLSVFVTKPYHLISHYTFLKPSETYRSPERQVREKKKKLWWCIFKFQVFRVHMEKLKFTWKKTWMRIECSSAL